MNSSKLTPLRDGDISYLYKSSAIADTIDAA
jgi:hypothetical protein